MKTLSATEARSNLTHWLKQAAKGEDIGIVCNGQIVALRPVQVFSEDYAAQEYGLTAAELNAFADSMDKEIADDKKHGRLHRYSGNLEKDIA